MRAVPLAIAWRTRARADVTPTWGDSPRYGSISCDGNGSTARSDAAAVRPSNASDLLDNGRRRIALLDRYAHHAAAARLDDIAADNGVLGPVRAFDQDVGLQRGDQLVRGVFVEHDDRVHAGQRFEDLHALRF